MLDLIEKIGYPLGNVEYHYYNTGMEYVATQKHIAFLENRYGVKIYRHYAKMPVTVACRHFGVPFLSKWVSHNIMRLQKHDFKWEDGTFEDLLRKYPNCKSALRWWCNAWPSNSRCNISNNKYLREFMISNPPQLYRIACHDYSVGTIDLEYQFGHEKSYLTGDRLCANLRKLRHTGLVTMELYRHNKWVCVTRIHIEKEGKPCAE